MANPSHEVKNDLPISYFSPTFALVLLYMSTSNQNIVMNYMKRHFLLSMALLFCAIIGASRAHAQAQWNTNLLQNTIPTSNSQFTGWEKTANGGTGWRVDNNCFCSSYNECVLSQTITLADYGFTADNLSGKELYASVQYEIPRKSTNQSGICIVAVVCLDGSGVALDTLYLLNMTGYKDVEVASTIKDSLFALPAGTTQLRYELHGRDQVHWSGQYGPRFTDMKMMLIDRTITYTASIDPAIGDSITLSKTSIHFGDTIEVNATYPDHPILYLILNGNQRVDTNRLICRGGNLLISAHLRYSHAITLSAQNATLTASETVASAGDTITLTHTVEQGYIFARYTVTPDVQWLDEARFIMPDAEVKIFMETLVAHTVPFFEGFEEGNKQGEVVQGWLQLSEDGSGAWQANSIITSNNRTPYAGKWNATLRYSNTDWLFTSIRLEAGKLYRISMQARQDEASTYYANIRACLGKAAYKDSMNITILPETGITNGEYQTLTDTFSVATTGVYVLGIRGYISGSPFYLSLDNIRIDENKSHTITFLPNEHGSLSANKTTAYAGDTIALTAAIDEGYGLNKFLFTPSIRCIDNTRFIMPDEDLTIGFSVMPVAAVPFFEGFENGNTQDSVIQGWLQQSEYGDYAWRGNSNINYNRTPYAGNYNTMLFRGNTDWLFTYIRLEAGKQYRISMMARQDGSNTSYANIRACLGKAATKDSMTTTIIAQKAITNGEYQTLTDTFRVAESGVYALGIRGYIHTNSNYLSLDNIRVDENQSHTITVLSSEHSSLSVNKTTAYAGDTVMMTASIDEGYTLHRLSGAPAVRRIDDTRFIMPDEDLTIGIDAQPITSLPFFDGFEEGNTQGAAIAGWLQQSISGDSVWQANSTFTNNGRAPHTGKWNATLYKDNTDWMFRYVPLEAGKTYRFSMYARQSYGTAYYTSIHAYVGNTALGDSMKIRIFSGKQVLHGDYELLTDTFRVADSGVYALGICGYLNINGYYLSIDNIRLSENTAHAVHTTDAALGTIVPSKTAAYVGDTITLTHTMAEGEIFINYYVTNEGIRWLDDHRFIMPDEEVTVGIRTLPFATIPFSEGFENGNTDQVAVAGWGQYSEVGKSVWRANSTKSDYGRTPYAGKWNAYLAYGNTDWLFMGLVLEADTEYELSFYTRQNESNRSYANVSAFIGTAMNKDSMTLSILPETGVTSGNYQLVHARFSVPASGKYVLGIRGYINTSPMYLSIDNIRVRKHEAMPITAANPEYGTLVFDKQEANLADTVTVSRTMNANCYFRGYTTNVSVRWINANRFIMPDTAVIVGIDAITPHTIPFVEDFENGNTQGQQIAGWVQQGSYSNSSYWTANSTFTDYGRTPYEGNWNAWINSSPSVWMFNAFALEANKEYTLTFRARRYTQDNENMYVLASLGTDCRRDSMKMRILERQDIKNGDYQLVHARFSVSATGNYVLGIYAYASSSISDKLSIDDIRITEYQAQTYTVAIVNSEFGTLSVSTATAHVGDTITVSHTMAADYVLDRFTTSAAVRWISATQFIMPDENVEVGMLGMQAHALPFFEGFEEGNEQGKSVAGWKVAGQDEKYYLWKANSSETTYNRTPYEGSWNAYLFTGDAYAWMFNAVTLEAGKTYTFSICARQSDPSNSSSQKLKVCLGNAANEETMTTTILPEVALQNGDYQPYIVNFTVQESGNYALGIYGSTNSGNYCISIDNIRLMEKSDIQHTIHLATTECGTLECQSSAVVGDTVVVRSKMNVQYVQSGITADKVIRWLSDTCFVMPDEEITLTLQGDLAHTLPFFEGFENGNEQDKTIVGWKQQSVAGSNVWIANSTYTDYNRTPYEGSWNATLKYSNTDWLFCALQLEQGKRYRVSLYARHDGTYKSSANISISLGSMYGKDAMTLNILPSTGLINGDYQRIEAVFTVPATAAYVMGIRGYINSTPFYLSLDNILVEELPAEVVTAVASETTLSLTTYTEEAIRAALSALTLTAVDDNDSTVCTITNDAARWVIDLPLYTATYTLTIDDLPVPYVFADDTETLRVMLKKDVDTGIGSATADKPAARLIIEQDMVYVLMPDGSRYTVTGQKVNR